MSKLAEKRLSKAAKRSYDGWELIHYGGASLEFKHAATGLKVHLSCDGYPFMIPKIKYSDIAISLDCEFTQEQWSPANTIADILAWINPTYGPFDIFALIDEEKVEEMPVEFAVLSIDPSVAEHAPLKHMVKEVLIPNKTELITKENIIAGTMKDSAMSSVDTKSGYTAMVVSESPVMRFKLKHPFSEWNELKTKQFIKDFADILGVDTSELQVTTIARGSVELEIMMNTTLRSITDQWDKTKVLFADSATSSIDSLAGFQIDKKELVNIDDLSKSKASAFTLSPLKTKKKMSSAQKWLINSSKKLKEQIDTVVAKCELKFRVTCVVVLHNQKVLDAFLKHPGYETNSRLLFKGKKYSGFTGLFEQGFLPKDQSSRDPGWYGKGHYFTSFPQYAMHYISYGHLPSEGRTYSLMVCHVNVGKVRTVYAREDGQPIPAGYDCNYIQVGLEGAAGYPWDPSKHNPPIYDEYAIRDSTRILPRYLITFKCEISHCFIWRDQKINNAENSGILMKLREEAPESAFYGVRSTAEAIEKVRYYSGFSHTHVITNGKDGAAGFVSQLYNDLGFKGYTLVFSSSMCHESWASKFTKCKVTTQTSDVYSFVKQKTHSY